MSLILKSIPVNLILLRWLFHNSPISCYFVRNFFFNYYIMRALFSPFQLPQNWNVPKSIRSGAPISTKSMDQCICWISVQYVMGCLQASLSQWPVSSEECIWRYWVGHIVKNSTFLKNKGLKSTGHQAKEIQLCKINAGIKACIGLICRCGGLLKK